MKTVKMVLHIAAISLFLVAGLTSKAFCDDVRGICLVAIKQCEMPVDGSHGVHEYDSVSYGHYGVTYAAVNELIRVKVLPEDADIDLADPVDNYFIASLYLRLMYERHGTWYQAVKAYHGKDDGYADRVMNIVTELVVERHKRAIRPEDV